MLKSFLTSCPDTPTKPGQLCQLPPEKLPITGKTPVGLQDLDKEICSLLRQYDIPGCTVAIAKNGHLISSRGYGWSNIMRHEPVQPCSLFRLATSVSKIITAVAALKLCDEGKLTPKTKAFQLLAYPPAAGVSRHHVDPNLNDITVQHSAAMHGWMEPRTLR